MGILENKPDGISEPSWIRYIRNRILKKKNFLVLVTGQTGSGKSYTCLSVCSTLDKNFNVNRVVFGLRGLMELINSGDFPAGTCIMWDEFQLDASNRNWQSLTNKLLNSLLSTFRHKNFILIINAPYSDFIDSHTKKLLHSEWEVTGIDYASEMTILKPQVIQYNSRRKQFYYKYLRVRTSKGVSPVTKWKVPKPSKDLVEAYEKKKTEFTSALNEDIERQLNKLDNRHEEKRKPLTEIQARVLQLMSKYGDTKRVAEELSLDRRTIQFHVSQARKKGYEYGKTTDKERKDDKGVLDNDISFNNERHLTQFSSNGNSKKLNKVI